MMMMAPVMMMARVVEAVVTVHVAAVVVVPAVVAVRPVLHLLDGVAGRHCRLGLDRERGGLCGAGRRSEPEAGHCDRQGGGLDHGLPCACKHCRELPYHSNVGYAGPRSRAGPRP